MDRARRDVHFSVKCPLFRFFLLGWARRLLDHNLSGRVVSTDVSLQIVVRSLVSAVGTLSAIFGLALVL